MGNEIRSAPGVGALEMGDENCYEVKQGKVGKDRTLSLTVIAEGLDSTPHLPSQTDPTLFYVCNMTFLSLWGHSWFLFSFLCLLAVLLFLQSIGSRKGSMLVERL